MSASHAALPPVLETRALAMSYPGTRALDGVSLVFPAGRVSALIGRNGAGKSTLVKILSGAVRPTEGAVLLDGVPVELRSPAEALARGIATVHQELSLVPGLSAAENVLLGRFPRRRGSAGAAIDWSRLYSEAGRLLQSMDVRVDPRAIVAGLPLAQRQMIEIARAVSSGARAVLFDEPTAGLARAEVRILFRLVRGLAEQGVAVLYITHQLAELAEIADTVTALRDGRAAATISAASISSSALVAMMYGEDAAAAVAHPADRPERAEPAAAAPPVLQVEGLGIDGVLHDVSFAVRRGEILGIAGMLGSGRTELLLALFGARPAERGRLIVRSPSAPSAHGVGSPSTPGASGVGSPSTPSASGVASPSAPSASGVASPSAPSAHGRADATRSSAFDASSASPARLRRLGVGLVPEDRKTQGLVPGMSVLDNLCLASLARTARRGVITPSRQRRAAAPAAEELDLAAPDLAGPVSTLSGGNQQKVVFGKWLLRSPSLLLCDEPARGIDVRAKGQLFETLRALSRRGIAAIVVSSELEELLEVCHRILVLRHGTLAGEYRPEDLTLDGLVGLCMESGEPALTA